MLGRVNKMRLIISVQTHQRLMLIDFSFAKILKHPDRPPLAAFAGSKL